MKLGIKINQERLTKYEETYLAYGQSYVKVSGRRDLWQGAASECGI